MQGYFFIIFCNIFNSALVIYIESASVINNNIE